jgi:hypothetical protein
MLNALKTHWPSLLFVYCVVLLATLYFGLRHQQKGTS